VVLVGLCLLSAPGGSLAQPVIQTPAKEFRLPEPAFGAESAPELALPPVPPFPPEQPWAGGRRTLVRSFRFEGNTVFDEAELAAVVAPWSGREIGSEELQAARDAVTRHYVERGYVNSGAVIPNQQVEAGVVLLHVIEGRLEAVVVEGTRRFRPSYFQSRLMIGAEGALRIEALEERLQILQQEPRIRRLAARLEPGRQPGGAVLHLRVEEEPWWQVGLDWDNDTPASLGEQTGRTRVGLANLLGVGDELLGTTRFSKGLLDLEASYRVPLNRWDTALEGRFRRSDGKVVEEPFAQADFEARTLTAGIGILQPLWRSPATAVRVALLGEWRRSHNWVDGRGFGFPGTGADLETGESTLAVLRFGGEWLHRTRSRVLALRQLASVGLPVLGASENPSGIPDSRFASFLTQLRYAERFERLWGTELLFRTDLQLSTEPLMPIEQIGVGGLYTVRGYRQNQLVRDQAVIASVEARLPLYRSPGRAHLVQLAPFVDVGHGWSSPQRDVAPPHQTLFSVGVGIRYAFLRYLQAELYWGASLSTVPDPPTRTLQDDGIYFRVAVEYP
jgi:hemolysin activation/secretion protein